ncbi:MAG: cache domain-containing protein [Bacillaceae bacterium]|nr:cache domain-containing protein [Bacillaceae bacterium]
MRQLLSEEHTNKQLMNVYFDLNKHLERVKTHFNAYEVGVMVMGNNGVKYATDDRTHWPISDEKLAVHPVTMNTLKEPRWLQYHFYQQPTSDDSLREENFLVISRAFVEHTTDNVYGVMYFTIKESELRKFYSNFTTPGNDLLILDSSGKIVSSNQTELIGEKEVDLLDLAEKHSLGESSGNEVVFMGKEHILFAIYLPTYDMYLLNLIDKNVAIGNFVDKKSIVLISMSIVFYCLNLCFLPIKKK